MVLPEPYNQTSLIPLLEKLDDPISAFHALRDDAESVVADVESWRRNYSDLDLAHGMYR